MNENLPRPPARAAVCAAYVAARGDSVSASGFASGRR